MSPGPNVMDICSDRLHSSHRTRIVLSFPRSKLILNLFTMICWDKYLPFIGRCLFFTVRSHRIDGHPSVLCCCLSQSKSRSYYISVRPDVQCLLPKISDRTTYRWVQSIICEREMQHVSVLYYFCKEHVWIYDLNWVRKIDEMNRILISFCYFFIYFFFFYPQLQMCNTTRLF